jgi:hypothetical protein
MSMAFDNAKNVGQLVSAKLIFLGVQNKTNSCNSGVLAYKVNPLMMVVATTLKHVGIWTDHMRIQSY